jgi:tripartite-type tricarboxylate transporter receptor subunit TctC
LNEVATPGVAREDKKMKRPAGISLVTLCAGLLYVASAALAQNYPSRPIRLVVPYPPGGNVDITARIITPGLGELLGQTIVVDNRSGAGGNLGAALVAKATPDGYTLLMGSSGPLAINPIVYAKRMPYDPLKDFAPVSLVHVVPLVLLASNKSGIDSVKTLLDRAKANPGKVTMATAGVGTTNHFGLELIAAKANVKFLHVPYKGSGPALAELLGNQVQTMVDQLTSSIGYIRDGRVRILAVASKKRSPALPGVPTLEESGVPGVEASTFIGVLAPARTPKTAIAKLNASMVKVMARPSVLEKLRALGTEPGSSSPAEFEATIREGLGKWRGVAKDAGLKFD